MKPGAAVFAFAGFALVVVVLAPFIGPDGFAAGGVHPGGEDIGATVFWELRVPRVIAAFLAGAALAVCGMAFQALFRNPLATPFTLGVSSGASFGAALALQLGVGGVWFGISGASIAAFAGAMISTSLVYGLTFMRGGFSTATLLLAGVAVSFFFSSLILFVQYTADVYNAFRMLRWVMGGLSIVDYDSIWGMLPFVVAGAVVLWLARHELNLFVLGDDLAMGRGVDVPRVKRLLFFTVSLTVGGVVAVCGPIGFVGMMVPHMCRLIVGPDHRYLAPGSALFGGAFLVLCDTLARIVLAPAELPVGIVTALLGGPFFLWLLLSGAAQRNLA
jgi:iron complex transport system permease protein